MTQLFKGAHRDGGDTWTASDMKLEFAPQQVALLTDSRPLRLWPLAYTQSNRLLASLVRALGPYLFAE